MCIWRPVFLVALVLVVVGVLSATALCESDESAAERILGPQWKHLSRRAGMVFAGTVLSVPRQAVSAKAAPEKFIPAQAVRMDRAVPSIALRFRVDRAIAGVQAGQTLTIREWTGAWSLSPAMRRGEHVLLFLYPPSWLGLTSPVDGAKGQVRLDATGRTSRGLVTVDQLDRAIRFARGE